MKYIQQSIDLASFVRDPYPALTILRRDAPIAYVPELGAILMTKRGDMPMGDIQRAYSSNAFIQVA